MNVSNGSKVILLAQDVHKKFKKKIGKCEVQALNGATIEVIKGEACGLVGPNGAGKSTLIKTIIGIERNDSGEIDINFGLNSSIGYVPEKSIFFEDLSAYENLFYFADLCDVDNAKFICNNLLEEFDLDTRKEDLISTFSKGMRQRTAIARALINNPSILILDEPFSGLDPSMALELRRAIVKLKESGKTLLLSSHDLADVEAICDSVAFMKSGKIVKKVLLKSFVYQNAVVEMIFSTKKNLKMDSLDDIIEVRSDNELDTTIVLNRSNIPKIIKKLVEGGIEIEEVKILNNDLSTLYSEIIMDEGKNAI
ncbi:MAG: ABC transporter ATP-binding protein [Lutibacter sp.]|jgi:ABC-2 type transport system ATP-binding protein